LTASQCFQELGYVVTRANDSPVAIARSSLICGFLCIQNRYFRLIMGFDREERKVEHIEIRKALSSELIH
jgi:hypothetical protein